MATRGSFRGGLELKFFPNAEFESLQQLSHEETYDAVGRNLLRLIMMGWNQDWSQLISLSFVKSIFVHRNHEFLRRWRLAFQEGFHHVFTQIQEKEFTEQQHEQIQMYISNCICMLPYTDLTPFESMKIPQRIGDRWEMVEFAVKPIELTAQEGFRHQLLQDHDRVFAYGFEPIEHPKAHSILVPMGTTYPAGQGFLTQIRADMKGFETVGNSLYKSGRSRLIKWMERQTGSIHVAGVSLGGSLSLALAIDLGDKLSRVDALNPAGLHEDRWQKSEFDHWDEFSNKPKVVVQRQANDPVSLFGVWKKEWDILKVTPPQHKQGPIDFCDHFINYAGFADTEFSYLDPEAENNQRRTRNLFLYSIGRAFIYYLILIPFSYVLRPIGLFVWKHKLFFGMAIMPALLLALLAGFSAISLTALTIGFAGVLLAGLCYSIAHFIGFICRLQTTTQTDGEHHAKLHDPTLARNASMDMYNPENEIEVQLQYQDLHTYYDVTRCLLKHKDFLPQDTKPSKHVKDLSKKDVLVASLDPQNSEKLVNYKATKAKIMHIRHTLHWVSQIGRENEEELQEALEQGQSEYQFGKHYRSS